jgi:hypothetical protein
MTRSLRLLYLLVPLALGLASAAAPGRAQVASDPRFAFADTTLLRDTLGLRFDRLFELADSLGLRPDTLRALSVRYGFVPSRMVELADSMRVRVDSVGVVLLRERFNPLAARAERSTEFEYTTGYTLQQTTKIWTNNGSFQMTRGPLFVRSNTSVQITRQTTARRTTVRQVRDAETEAGWRLNPDASVGGRAKLSQQDSDDPSTPIPINDTRADYQLSLRTRQRPAPGLATELNAFSGVLNDDESLQRKRGGSGEVNGKLVYALGDWLTNDFSAQVTGNLARTELKRFATQQSTRDFGQSYRGNVTLFPGRRLGFIGDFTYRDFRVQTPDDSGRVRGVRNGSTDVTLALQGRLDNDRQLNLTQNFDASRSAAAQRSARSTRRGTATSLDGRYRLFGASMEARFVLDRGRLRSPTLTDSGGYAERTESRQLEGSLNRLLAPGLTGRALARISLARYRYAPIGSYPSLPSKRDQAAQSYRIEAAYNPGASFNTSAGLEVGRTELVNLTPTTVTGNNLLRTYRADWTWTYRLFTRLTATQRNVVSANYTAYPFNRLGDRLLLDYGTTTTLNAVLTPRLTVDLTHNGQEQPSGSYIWRPDLGGSFFQPADENRNYQLGARVSWTPVPGVTTTIEPRYRASNRLATGQAGEQVPSRENRNLTFAGGLNLNLTIGARGRLTGNVGRQFNADRTRTYSSGVVKSDKLTEIDYWTGNLQFAWRLR